MSANQAPTSAPVIPQRPARSPANASPAPPTVPARPKSRVDRPKSPALVNAYAQSPLNQRPESPCKPTPATQPTQQPPTVKIPSIGQEGVEYADYDRLKAEAETELDAEAGEQRQQEQEQKQEQEHQNLQPHQQLPSGQTRGIAQDLKLHSPRPSSGNTQARVSNIARNGLDNNNNNNNNNNTTSSSRPSLSSRPSSMIYADSETGSDRPASNATNTTTTATPGTRVPMYPGAGEVQAPTPRSDSTKPRASGELARPPDSYGLHSHDIEPTSKLDKEWYQKHPEAQERKEKISKAMHGPRPENALSSDALNKLVRDTARKNEPRSQPGYMGTPDEEIGYRATDQIVSRLHLSRPSSRPASIRSAFRQPADKDELDDIEGVSVHIDGPEASSHPTETGEPEQAREPVLSPEVGAEQTTTSDSPVLAADEMDKAHHLPAAIPPMEWKTHSRASSTNGRPKGFNRKTTSSSDAIGKDSARKSPASSIQQTLHESEVTLPEEDHEPLFMHEPEDEQARLDRFKKRPDLAEHRFPSKDVWEDSPDSTHLETVVDAPEPVPEGDGEEAATRRPSVVPAQPQQEKQDMEKKQSDIAGLTPPVDNESQLHSAAAKELGKKPELARASSSFDALRYHFPSKDIWEDAPDSAHLEATIQEPGEKAEEPPTPVDVLPSEPPHQQQAVNKPIIPARPARPAKRPVRSAEDKETTAAPATTATGAVAQLHPATDTAPPVTETKKEPPVIPGRPKPQIPARPSRSRTKSPTKQDPATATATDVPLSRTTSGASATSTGSGNGTDTTVKAAPVPKPKPAIPARPVGSKIAALQAGFLSDLNNRLKIGPHGPPPPKPQARSSSDGKEKKDAEGETKTAPLSDARKGRAKGPARRKPAAKPVAAGTAEKGDGKGEVKFEIVKAWNIFGISESGVLTVNSQPKVEEKKEKEQQQEEKSVEEQKKVQEAENDQVKEQKHTEEKEEAAKVEAGTAEVVKEVASADGSTAEPAAAAAAAETAVETKQAEPEVFQQPKFAESTTDLPSTAAPADVTGQPTETPEEPSGEKEHKASADSLQSGPSVQHEDDTQKVVGAGEQEVPVSGLPLEKPTSPVHPATERFSSESEEKEAESELKEVIGAEELSVPVAPTATTAEPSSGVKKAEGEQE